MVMLSKHGVPQSPIALPLPMVLKYSALVTAEEVNANRGDINHCEECGTPEGRRGGRHIRLFACAGSFPACAGQAHPKGALGKHYKCRRAVICTECKFLPERRGGSRTYKTGDWLCSHCCRPPDSHEAAWGSDRASRR
jgi:hypothetical protein